MSSELAAVAALAYVALYVGHQVGDHIVQTERQAVGKGAPRPDQLTAGVHPWQGWRQCIGHVTGYTLTQAVAVGIAFAGLGAPVPWHGAAAALSWSAATHAVIDRGWLVGGLLRLKGASGWENGRYLIDQSLHIAALLVAALLMATVTDLVGVAVATLASTAVVAAGLWYEWRRLPVGCPPLPPDVPAELLAKSTD